LRSGGTSLTQTTGAPAERDQPPPATASVRSVAVAEDQEQQLIRKRHQVDQSQQSGTTLLLSSADAV
jgi:hypothetical protein